MTTKEKIIKKSIDAATKELAEVKELLDANPYSELAKLTYETIQTVQKLHDQKKFEESLKVLDSAKKEQKRLERIIAKQKDYVGLCDRQYDLEKELRELNSELFYLEKKFK